MPSTDGESDDVFQRLSFHRNSDFTLIRVQPGALLVCFYFFVPDCSSSTPWSSDLPGSEWRHWLALVFSFLITATTKGLQLTSSVCTKSENRFFFFFFFLPVWSHDGSGPRSDQSGPNCNVCLKTRNCLFSFIKRCMDTNYKLIENNLKWNFNPLWSHICLFSLWASFQGPPWRHFDIFVMV